MYTYLNNYIVQTILYFFSLNILFEHSNKKIFKALFCSFYMQCFIFFHLLSENVEVIHFNKYQIACVWKAIEIYNRLKMT